MTDMDFDELDKAVNSLMNQQEASENPALSPAAPPTSPMSAASVASDVASSPPQQMTNDINMTPTPPQLPSPLSSDLTPAPTPAQPPAVKRATGRFMDVVHPSSDMMSARPVKPQPSRTGVTLEPRQDSPTNSALAAMNTNAQENTEVPPMQNAPTETSSAIDTATMAEKIAASLEEADNNINNAPAIAAAQTTPEMAPVDTMSEASSGIDTEEKNNEPASITTENIQSSAENVKGSETEEASQLDSPFLPNATVEKRPLGAPRAVDGMTSPAPQDSSFAAPSSNASVAATPPAITADAETQPLAINDDEPASVPMFAAIGEQPNGDALQHAGKKKSGWKTVIIILILILLGVAGGAAAYFLLLQ